ncbi:hypothetical protein [Marinagarivorans cellulosilyticus]|uniref:Uncharacterized protein n=1 Tax=Marinagarivorans cellulosilyticus TaxID=2721545 RepID=A0AAN2BKB9_9GAMM|nr:hypothetical protein [Marinagarivorans cellulosilyticus]BCD97864.1 hypothetical protein MARGE09_P2065 [Marinagarivorans cellulosilyticus]
MMWLLYVAVIAVVITVSNHMPAVVLSLYLMIFAIVVPAYCIILTVSIITGSEGWSIIVIVFSNVVSTVAFNFIASNPEITGAFNAGTFRQLGFIWPSWSESFFVVVGVITLIVITVSIVKGWGKEDFF